MLTKNEVDVLKLAEDVPRTVMFWLGEIVPEDAYDPPFIEAVPPLVTDQLAGAS
jgi:hypothetical protein